MDDTAISDDVQTHQEIKAKLQSDIRAAQALYVKSVQQLHDSDVVHMASLSNIRAMEREINDVVHTMIERMIADACRFDEERYRLLGTSINNHCVVKFR